MTVVDNASTEGTADLVEGLAREHACLRLVRLPRNAGPVAKNVALARTTADVAVLHPGQNSLAEVAALRLPAIVVPADRPFAEQRTTASVLADGWPAVVVDGVPARGWDDLLDEALFLDGEGWAEWCDGGAPTRLASVVGGVVDDDDRAA